MPLRNKPNLGPSGEFSWMALKIVGAMSVIFVLQAVFPRLTETFALDRYMMLLRPWTLVSYIFLHGSFSHLFSNMFSLFIFGSMLERVVGRNNFLKVFLATGVFSGLVGMLFYDSVIGASGSVFGIMGVLAVLRPKMVVWALGVPMYMIAAIFIYALLDLGGVFYPSSIAHIGHLSALVAGILIGLAWRKRYTTTERKRERLVLDEDSFSKWEEKYMRQTNRDDRRYY